MQAGFRRVYSSIQVPPYTWDNINIYEAWNDSCRSGVSCTANERIAAGAQLCARCSSPRSGVACS